MDNHPTKEQLNIMEVHKLNRMDPLHRQADRGLDVAHGLSPMDPPDAYAPAGIEPVPVEALHPFLRKFRDEHVPFMNELNAFEAAVLSIKNNGYTKEADAKLRHFFQYFDREFVPHSRREEATLFPLLRQRLIASGEHGSGSVPATATEVMEDEHAKAMQLAAVVVNFLGLVFRLPDERSAMIVLDAALEQGKSLVELLRLHVFREDNILSSLAHRLIAAAEFDAIQLKAAQ